MLREFWDSDEDQSDEAVAPVAALAVAAGGAHGDSDACNVAVDHDHAPDGRGDRTIGQSRNRALKDKASEAVRTLSAIVNPTLADAVSSNVFGLDAPAKPQAKQRRVLTSSRMAITVDETRQQGRERDRGLVSHFKASKVALYRFIDCADVLVVNEAIDDATMLCKRPAEEKDAADRHRRCKMHPSKKLKGKSRGRTIGLSCMSVVQHLSVIRKMHLAVAREFTPRDCRCPEQTGALNGTG